MEEFVEKASDFYADIFTVEWNKMVVPVIMVLALSVSAYSTLDLRNSPESEERIELSVEAMTNLSESFLRTSYFNDSVNKTGEEISREIEDKIDRRQEKLNTDNLKRKSQIAQIQKLGLFPFTPELYTPVHAGRKDAVSALGIIQYRQDRFDQLDKRLNSSENISLEEFDNKIEEIRDSRWEDQKVQDFVENYSYEESNGAVSGLGGDIRESMKTGDIQELTFMDYIPAIFATFVLYYVLNALAVETGRKAYRQINISRNNSEDEKDSERDEKTGEEKQEKGEE